MMNKLIEVQKAKTAECMFCGSLGDFHMETSFTPSEPPTPKVKIIECVYH